ncbi:hypothetical protein [Pseudomonas sp. UMAB-40]|uniref:hypothetical protein n=1 Tax=Pseudomonas sp. UMAB-40 TaxID=1365407 RepID=UPI001C576E67|nr:hypothetical protein [Pseudomonas sp. UMAB-40]
MFASKSTGGFYDVAIHGARLVTIQDPAWVRPKTDIVVQPGESTLVDGELITNNGDEPITLRDLPDMNAIPDVLVVVNPDCSIPDDAVEITSAYHAELLAGESGGKIISWRDDGYPVLVEPPVIVLSCPALCAQIDAAADKARAAVAGDPLRAVEYQRSADQAQAFKDAGYPAESVPAMVAAWAITGRTARQAADNILAEANAYYDALTWIRATRLAAKEQVRALMENEQQAAAEALANTTVSAIRAAVAGIGNNTSPQARVELEQ